MTDYHPLIARAVDGLAKNSGEARRSLYERARAALVAQLRAVEPALSESDITKERLALEEAIRKVESDAARKALAEPRSQVRSEPRPQAREVRLDQRAAAAPPRGPAGGMRPPLDLAAAMRRERPNSVATDLAAGDAGEPPQGEAAQSIQREEAAQAEASSPSAKASARNRILEARTSTIKAEGLRGFRNFLSAADGLGAATAKAAQTARDTRDSYAPGSRQRAAPLEDDPPSPEQFRSHFDEEELPPVEDDLLHLRSLEPSYDLDEVEPIPASRSLRPHVPRLAEDEEGEEEYEEPRPPRSYRGLAKFVLVLIIVLGVAATAWQYRSNIAGIYQYFSHIKSQAPAQTTPNPVPVSKFPGRVPQEQVPGQAPSASTNPGSTEPAPTVAQRAVLYEADPNDPQGKRFAGSVVWRTETVSPGPGLAPELAVRADISIPERHMTVTWSLRRNTDKALPASHTIEIMFNLPPDFPGGGISNVPGILMKDSEEVRGMPLAGLAVKVTNGFFLIGLNAADADMQRNIQLLKERDWFDILIVYNNGSRAILTIGKGPPGERAFAEAFKAWGQ